MIVAYIKGFDIIPYESIEYVVESEYANTLKGCVIHMAESKKYYTLLPGDADEFKEGYLQFLELKEAMIGIVNENGSEGPRRKS